MTTTQRTIHNQDKDPKEGLTLDTTTSTSRSSGLWYLSLIVFGIFAELTRSSFIADTAAETATNIMNNSTLYRLALVSDLVMMVSFLMVAVSLNRDFRVVDPSNSRLFLIFVSVCVPILTLNMLNHYAPLVITSNPAFLSDFTLEQKNGMVMLFLELHSAGYYLAQVFFGLWLLPLGTATRKHDSIPNIISLFLIIAGVSHLFDVVGVFLFPEISSTISMILALPIVLGEFSFAFWILVKGIKHQTKS